MEEDFYKGTTHLIQGFFFFFLPGFFLSDSNILIPAVSVKLKQALNSTAIEICTTHVLYARSSKVIW